VRLLFGLAKHVVLVVVVVQKACQVSFLALFCSLHFVALEGEEEEGGEVVFR
jgi:hypothetical protein